jgi:phytoene dehydrogenase-like protein
MDYDVIVIGGGHNSLTAAGLLAKAGRKVLVLEKRDRLGGLAAMEEFHPGYRVPGLLHDTASVRPSVIDALELQRHGLALRHDEIPIFLPLSSGGGLHLQRNAVAAGTEIRNFSMEDASRYAEFQEFLERIRPFFLRVLDRPAPELAASGWGHLFELAGSALALRRLSQKDMIEILRIGPMSVADWLNERFEGSLLKAGLAQSAVLGTWMGPWSAGTVVNFLLDELRRGFEILGGPAALVAALEASCRSRGAEIRTGCAAARILIDSGRVRGVALQDGSEITAGIVVSGCDPKRTVLQLIDPRDIPSSMATAISHWRCRGTTAKLHLALSGPLEFSGRPGTRIEAARTGEELDDLERAFDAVKYDECSHVPILDVRIPTISDPSLAPEGHHVVSILASFAPYHLRGGWTEERRKSFGDAVVAALSKAAPSLSDRIVAGELLTPVDLEERYGITGGHIHHGEHALDQLFSLRPHPSCARQATPLPGLFLASGGTHPGGGITCASGALAAEAVLTRRG